MITTAQFLTLAQWSGILTLVFGAIAGLAFLLKWGIRFRLVGATGFMIVLTGGLFALSLVPFTRTAIPGAVRYTMVYDNCGNQTVIAVSPKITETELDATLRQAASDFFSYGRLGGANNQLTIRARTVVHPEPGVSQPLLLGQISRSLASRNDEENGSRNLLRKLCKDEKLGAGKRGSGSRKELVFSTDAQVQITKL